MLAQDISQNFRHSLVGLSSYLQYWIGANSRDVSQYGQGSAKAPLAGFAADECGRVQGVLPYLLPYVGGLD